MRPEAIAFAIVRLGVVLGREQCLGHVMILLACGVLLSFRNAQGIFHCHMCHCRECSACLTCSKYQNLAPKSNCMYVFMYVSK